MAEKEKIVYAYVVADLLHTGHVLALENAKSFGGEDAKLIVGVLTDEATMEKKSKPVINFSERLRLIKALKCVDAAVPQETYSPIPNIKLIKPDIMMESASHSAEALLEVERVVSSWGGKVLAMPYYPEQSSTKIKEGLIGNSENSDNQESKTK